jgi:hypothetical protein
MNNKSDELLNTTIGQMKKKSQRKPSKICAEGAEGMNLF